jgi:hypothetical protein
MKQISSLEQERLKHVNAVSNELHDSCDEIYESLVDHDYKACQLTAKKLILQLKSLIDSMDDDL